MQDTNTKKMINNKLIGYPLYLKLVQLNKAKKKAVSEAVDNFFLKYGMSMDANEHLYIPLEQEIRQSLERITGGRALDMFVAKILSETATGIMKKNVADFSRYMPTVQNVFENQPRQQANLEKYVRENIRLIKNIDAKQEEDIFTVVFGEIQRGSKKSEIIRSLSSILDRTDNGYKIIARDQATKLYSSITETRANANGWEFYEWSTSNDVRVRSKENSDGYADHARLHGKIFKFSEPPVTVFKGKRSGSRNNPGMDIQCRCVAIPLFDPPKAFKKNSDGSYSYKKNYEKIK